jgi:adenylosuccinate synthase
VNFIRSPTWITPPQQDAMAEKATAIFKDLELDGDNFTPQQIEKFKSSPEYYLEFVKAIEEEINNKFSLVSITLLKSYSGV